MRDWFDELALSLWHAEPVDGALPALAAYAPGPAPAGARVDMALALPRAPEIPPPGRDDVLFHAARMRRGRLRILRAVIAFAAAPALGWLGGLRLQERVAPASLPMADTVAIHAVVERIIRAESNGDPNARNKRSSATGAGQFLDGTWLDMIRAHRPDLANLGAKAALDLRFDAALTREMTARFAERNAAALTARGLPVTPGTLYLSHFAGSGGAVALLTAPRHVDAASVMALADTSGQTTREKIVKANPFLDGFTVADLVSWGDRKMEVGRGPRVAEPPLRAANR